MKRSIFLLLIALFSLQLTACQTPNDAPAEDSTQEESVEDSTEEPAEETVEEEETREPGETPFDFPADVSTDAQAGDFVLTPSRSTLDDAFEEGGEDSVMIFYSRVMLESGDAESVVEEFSEEVSMPNSLLVHIPAGETAQPGDIVLTWWQSGSGMTRAIIVEGGSEREPLAEYLDLSFDYEPERLKLDSFHLLSEEMEPGTTVAVREGGEYQRETVIKVVGDKVLTSGFASIIHVRDIDNITSAPIIPEVEAGDEVYIPVIGTYHRGTVTSIDTANGKVKVEYEWAGSTSEEDFAFGDVVEEL